MFRNRNDLAEVVALLKTHIDPELLKRDEELKNKLKDEEEGDKTESKGKHQNKETCRFIQSNIFFQFMELLILF